MAEDKQDPVPPRKRPAPTIDLKATEVASEPSASAQARLTQSLTRLQYEGVV